MSLRVLRIALDTQQSLREELPPAIEQQFLGGRGAAAWLLSSRVSVDVAPTSASNMLIFSAGPLVGVVASASGGFIVTTRSPLTGLIAHSWAIGRWGAMLRRAGIDLLAIERQSQEWCYIAIEDGNVSIRPADQLAGLDTYATAQAVRTELGGDWSVVCIGPAGEAGVAYSSIVADGLYPAEPAGTGKVMANKRVKAIAIRGSTQLVPADRLRADAVMSGVAKRSATSELAAGIRQYGGSLYYAAAAQERGLLSGRNGQDGELAHAQAINRVAMAQRGRREPRGCEGCVLPCASSYIRRNGEPMAYPELEAVAGFGAACGITTPDTIIIANDLCLRLGLDVTATSAAIAFTMECQQEGLSRAGTLPWGDGDAVLAAIRRLGQRQEKRDMISLGVGEIQDVYYGSGTFAPQVQGMAMPALDPRALPELALTYASSPIGSDHRYAMSYEGLLAEPPAWLPDGNHPQAVRGTVPRLIWHERFAAALDAIGICRRLALMAYQIAPSEVTELVSAALGRPFSGVEIAKLGERIVTFERLLAIHYESDRDGLPHRWTHDPLESGPALGKLPAIDELLAEYYRRHSWNEQGEPTPARLAELGIDPLTT
ncbi:MAG: aldehyde ferredoxin oxidoreductase C-terminal domain-containing protein [Roseiflexaceae bacterium]|nr:aldehyde ferredoxin oxidoreductase C-terminal domain-containing protein [Roseiflexaceae bacterium]